MSQVPATTIRIDPQLKNEACDIYKELGISLSAAISAFLKATVREKGLPFEMKLCEPLELDSGNSCVTEWTSNKSAKRSNAKTKNSSLNQAGLAKKD